MFIGHSGLVRSTLSVCPSRTLLTFYSSVVGINENTHPTCSHPHLGYTFDKTVASALQVPFSILVSCPLTTVFWFQTHNFDPESNLSDNYSCPCDPSHRSVLPCIFDTRPYPITPAAGLSFLALLTSLFMLRRGQNGTARLPSLLTLIVGSLAAVLTTIVFLIDVILVAVVRHRIQKASDGDLTLNWGNAVCRHNHRDGRFFTNSLYVGLDDPWSNCCFMVSDAWSLLRRMWMRFKKQACSFLSLHSKCLSSFFQEILIS